MKVPKEAAGCDGGWGSWTKNGCLLPYEPARAGLYTHRPLAGTRSHRQHCARRARFLLFFETQKGDIAPPKSNLGLSMSPSRDGRRTRGPR